MVLFLAAVTLIALGTQNQLEIAEVVAYLNDASNTIEVKVEMLGEPAEARLAGFGLLPGSGGYTTELKRDGSSGPWTPRLFDHWAELGGIEAKAYNVVVVGLKGEDGSWLLSLPRSLVSSDLRRESPEGSLQVDFNESGILVEAIGLGPCRNVGATLFLVGPMGLVGGGGGTKGGRRAFFEWPDDFVSQGAQVDLSNLVLLVYGHARSEDSVFLIKGPIVEQLGNPPSISWEESPEPELKGYQIG